MAAEILESHSVEVELIEGSGGIFEVEVDGDIVYDKAETGRFPLQGEVSDLLSRS